MKFKEAKAGRFNQHGHDFYTSRHSRGLTQSLFCKLNMAELNDKAVLEVLQSLRVVVDYFTTLHFDFALSAQAFFEAGTAS